MLSIENPLLKQEIKLLKEENTLCELKDSLKEEEITLYKLQLLKSENSRKKILNFSILSGLLLIILGVII